MDLVDTHCHIQSAGQTIGERGTRELWAKDPSLQPDAIIAEAREHGVARLLCVGCDLEDSRLAIDFVQDQPSAWASIGIHPHEAKDYANDQTKLDQFAALASQSKVVAIGECGFDFFYSHSPKEDQAEVLRFQLALAQEHNLPVIFHVREAFDSFWPIFDEFTGVRGVLHSFTDSEANLEAALRRGLYIGVNGIATFAKQQRQLDMYKAIPLDRLLLETDAPFLTPTPYRGSINTPKRVGTVADFLSELRSEERAALAHATTTNARTLFGLK